MKNLSALALGILAFFADAADLDEALLKAIENDRSRWVAHSRGAEAKEAFRVVDGEGCPVTNAIVRCAFRIGGAAGWQEVHGITDTNGCCAVIGMSKAYMDYLVDKDGYYQSHGKVDYMNSHSVPAVVDGKWQPYGETRTVVLKRIKNPGVLKVPSSLIQVEAVVPAYGEWLPFDLEQFDWFAPHGTGKHGDVLLRFRRRCTEKWNDFTYEMDVSFTNHPFAGVVKMEKDLSSDFATAYNADPKSNYESSFTYFLERTVVGGSKCSVLGKDSYLIFRTRTTVDEKGMLKTAHYGVIHGEWMPGKNSMSFADGCFNPNPNDTNIEDGHQLREVLRIGRRKAQGK